MNKSWTAFKLYLFEFVIYYPKYFLHKAFELLIVNHSILIVIKFYKYRTKLFFPDLETGRSCERVATAGEDPHAHQAHEGDGRSRALLPGRKQQDEVQYDGGEHERRGRCCAAAAGSGHALILASGAGAASPHRERSGKFGSSRCPGPRAGTDSVFFCL